MKHPLATSAEQVDFCAFCQNPCRLAAEDTVVPESQTPSAMSYLMRALRRGQIDLTDDVRVHLADRAGVDLLQQRCLYGYDIAGGIASLLAEFERNGGG